MLVGAWSDDAAGASFVEGWSDDDAVTILVEEWSDDAGDQNSGEAYLFDAVSGNLLHTFLNPTPARNDHFGWSVAFSGDKVLVGAPDDGAGAENSGTAYLFNAVSGNLLHTFPNPMPARGDHFGISVAISGDKVLVGARDDDAGAKDGGAAYLFDAATGDLLHTFLNPTPDRDDYFGWSVVISGDTVLVGAWLDDAGAEDSGAAYLFDAATGNLLHTFLNPTPARHNGFGLSVAISGDKVLVGTSWAEFATSFHLTDLWRGSIAEAKRIYAAYLFSPMPTSPR